MSDGSLAGLQAGKDLKLDAKRKQKAQQEMLARMTSEESGKNAKTIYRDKYGKKVDLAVEKARLAEEERKKEAEAEKDMVWGKGLVQQKEREEMVRKLRQERDRSFAIYRDDKELNKEQMEKDRWGDPMAKLIKKKNSKNKTVRPRYNGPPPPPNRFNIEPGYRWDGVDRSNGFEEKYFQMKNQKESISEVAYKWSTEDM
jgi:pre-mRNA-splicing factor CWC26